MVTELLEILRDLEYVVVEIKAILGTRQYQMSQPTSQPRIHKVVMSNEEFTKFTQYQMSQLPSSSSSKATLATLGKSVTCFSLSSRRWVTDSGATDHMKGD